MKRTYQILFGLSIASLSIILMAAVPEWIQYNERVVGENSPYYDDVVNRPMKQIWGNFTSQHTTDGMHKSFIFPTPIPTVAFPTPLPTATPQPTATPVPAFPTPLPTATPGPAFPTPLPTATPISSNVLDHPSDYEYHDRRSPEILISTTPATISYEGGACHGQTHLIGASGTINLPTNANINTYGCHTIRLFVTQNTGTVHVVAGSGSTIYYEGYAIDSDSDPAGSYLELMYSDSLDAWIPIINVGGWVKQM